MMALRTCLFGVAVDRSADGRTALHDSQRSTDLQCFNVEFLAFHDGCGIGEVNKDDSGSERPGMLALKRLSVRLLACRNTATTE